MGEVRVKEGRQVDKRWRLKVKFFWNRIVTATTPGVAAQDAFHS